MKKSNIFSSIFILTCLILSGCASNPTVAPTMLVTSIPVTIPTFVATSPISIPTATATAIPFSSLSLKPGDFYFSVDGQANFIISRNITGKTQEDFSTLLEWAHQGGTKLIRVHLTHGWWGDPWINPDWSVNEKWAKDWDWFFTLAQADGISVMPVFGVWADWNNGKPDLGSPFWQYNPLNVANGGPLNSPTSLFQSDSETQLHWLAWVKALVQRWQGRPNIAAWEIFSEINIATGAKGETDAKGGVSVAAAVDFTYKAMAVVRAADTKQRPVTLALATGAPFTNEWGKFYEQNSLDFIEIHPYSGTLDRELVTDVRENLARYNKPLMIGENGLWSTDSKPNAVIGVAHAIWAGLVSGAMNGRAFWGADSYSIYTISDRGQAFQLLQTYATAELPISHFVSGVDFSGFKPLKSTCSSGVWGAAIGNEKSVIGWFRDAGSEPPDWNLKPAISNQTVTITVPGNASAFQVDFYNTKDGTTVVSSVAISRKGSTIAILLPDFQDDIAFKMTAQAGTASGPAPATLSTDAIAGTWSGTITNSAGTFSTPVKLTIQAGCQPGNVCGTFSAPQLPCKGDLFLETINGESYLLQEQNVTGAAACQSGGYEQLQLLEGGTLTYGYMTTPGSEASSTGILKKP